MHPVIGVVDWPVLASQVDGLRASWDLGLRSIVRPQGSLAEQHVGSLALLS
jgi:hypothetical protein